MSFLDQSRSEVKRGKSRISTITFGKYRVLNSPALTWVNHEVIFLHKKRHHGVITKEHVGFFNQIHLRTLSSKEKSPHSIKSALTIKRPSISYSEPCTVMYESQPLYSATNCDRSGHHDD